MNVGIRESDLGRRGESKQRKGETYTVTSKTIVIDAIDV